MDNKEHALIRDEMSEEIITTAQQIALTSGAAALNVRKILKALNITNRVFYNRFHNIDEVLDIIYENTVLKVRESILRFDPSKDFFTQITDIVLNTLLMSYDEKMNFNSYVFENDSASNRNYEWWKNEIKRLLEFGIDNGHFKELDTEAMSYAIWCFIRGYNADAVARKLPQDTAVENFKYSFGVLLDGMKA